MWSRTTNRALGEGSATANSLASRLRRVRALRRAEQGPALTPKPRARHRAETRSPSRRLQRLEAPLRTECLVCARSQCKYARTLEWARQQYLGEASPARKTKLQKPFSLQYWTVERRASASGRSGVAVPKCTEERNSLPRRLKKGRRRHFSLTHTRQRCHMVVMHSRDQASREARPSRPCERFQAQRGRRCGGSPFLYL